MDRVLILIILLTVIFLILAPSMLLINCLFNDDQEDINDLTKENLMKLEIKRSLLNILELWIKQNDLTHVQIAEKLSININVVSNIVHQRFDKFTVDRLVGLVLRTGNSVEFIITKNSDKSPIKLSGNQVEILALAVEVFGSEVKANEWLNTVNFALGDKPLAIAQSEEGFTHVKMILNGIRYGGVV